MIGVIGSGLMGVGIAAVCALAGRQTTVIDRDETRLSRVRSVVEDIARSRGTSLVSDRLATSSDLRAIAGADFIFEAIPEKLEIKRDVYRQLESIVDHETIIASTTSSFMPSELAADLARPQRFIVAHFWNPAQTIDLVEVVPGAQTSRTTCERTHDLLIDIGQRPIRVDRELSGFIGNRLQFALLREALHLLDTGVASAEAIDDVVRSTLGPRYSRTGPLESADLGGIETFANIAANLFPLLAKDVDGMSQLTRLVERGNFGASSGAGFYEWDEQKVARRSRERDAAVAWNKRLTLSADFESASATT